MMVTFVKVDKNNTITEIIHGPKAGIIDKTPYVILADEAVLTARVGHTCKNGVVSPPILTTSQQWKAAREHRDMRLAGTDHQLHVLLLEDSFPSMTKSIKDLKITELQQYRAALRDITNQPDPANITWPTPPGVI